MTHYMPPAKFRSFSDPVRCGVRNWKTATDQPERVTCVACRSLLPRPTPPRPKPKSNKQRRRR